MVWGGLAVLVAIAYAVIYVISKETFVDWVFKGLEIVAVAILSMLITVAIGLITNDTKTIMVTGSIAVGIVFYFFGAMIHPYIIEIVQKITKNIGKKSDKKKKK